MQTEILEALPSFLSTYLAEVAGPAILIVVQRPNVQGDRVHLAGPHGARVVAFVASLPLSLSRMLVSRPPRLHSFQQLSRRDGSASASKYHI